MRSAIVLFLASLATVATGAHSEATNCLGTTPADCQRSEIVGGDYAMRSFAGGNFSNALVRDVSFAQSDLVVSVFDGARLESVNFREANLVGASFSGATLKDVDLTGADLRGARFDGAAIDLQTLETADTCMTTMPDETMNNEDCG